MADTALTLFEQAHARDAPFADYEAWLDALEFGMCTGCERDAWRGIAGWWHADGSRDCPERGVRPPAFSPDVAD